MAATKEEVNVSPAATLVMAIDPGKPAEDPVAKRQREMEEARIKAKQDKAARALETQQSEIKIVQSAIQKEHGKGALTTMSDHTLDLMRISTGILMIDLATGGGVPRGRITELFGPAESFKTSCDAGIIANAQRTCVNCGMYGKFMIRGMVKVKMLDGSYRELPNHVIYDCPCGNPRQFMAAHFDIEGSFEPDWFEARGVWLEHCYLSRPIVLEEAIDIVQAVLESGKFHMVSFDSVAAATSEKEVQRSASDQSMGGNSIPWNSAWRRWVLMQNSRYREAYDKGDASAVAKVPTIVVINQVRTKIGVMFGNPETTPGGGGGPFAASLRIRMQGGKVADEEGKTKKDKGEDSEGRSELATHLMSFKVVKSKVCPKGGSGEYLVCQQDTLYHRMGEIDQDKDLVDFGIKSKVIDGVPNNYTIGGVFERIENLSKKERAAVEKDGADIPLRRFRGKSEMEEFLATNVGEARRLYYEIVHKMTDVVYDGSTLPPKPEEPDEDEEAEEKDDD